MAKKLISASIATAQTIEAGHVSQSVKAFTGTEAYDITISGSLEITGSTDINGVLSIPGFSNVSASLATSFDGFPFTGSAGLLGTLDVNGPAGHITASGNISSSGNIFGVGYHSNGAIFAQFDSGIVNLGGAVLNPAALTGTSITLGMAGQNQPVTVISALTASGNISSSGNLFGDRIVASSYLQAPQINGNIEVTGNLTAVQITASGDISASGDLFARDITANDITLDAIGISDKPNVTLKRGSTTGISLQMGSGGNDNGLFIINNAAGLQDIRLEGLGHSFFSQSLNVGVPYTYPEPVGGTFTVRGTISSSGAISTLSHITASGNISSSNIVFGDTGSFKHITGNPASNSFLKFGTINEVAGIHAGDTAPGFGSLTFQTFNSNYLTILNGITRFNNVLLGSGSGGGVLHIGNSLNPVSANLTGHITASGNISASGDIIGATFGDSAGNIVFTGNVSGSGTNSSYFGNEYNAHGNDANSGFTILSLTNKPIISANNSKLQIGGIVEPEIPTKLNSNNVEFAGAITASGNISASGDLIGGGLNVVGISRMSSSASPSIVSVLTENDSHQFITGVTTTGPNFRMNLADANSSGSAYMAFGRQTGNFGGTGFTAHYATGSNASEGEIIMSIGKNGQLGQIQDRFIVQSEPGPIGSNTFSELSLFAGTHVNNLRVVQGVVQNGTGDFANFTAGNQDIATGFKKHVFFQYAFNNTSSFAGFASSSLNTGSTARNFNANSIPFGIDAGVSDSDTAFFIDRGGTFGASKFITASFEISKGGSISMEGGITASGTGLFQAGKPIITHTTSPISSSLVNAGRYHIVGGTLTASIVLDSNTPVGAEFEFFQTSSVGQFLFQSASGTTVISKNGSLRLAQQGSSAVLKKVSTTTFHLMGDLS